MIREIDHELIIGSKLDALVGVVHRDSRAYDGINVICPSLYSQLVPRFGQLTSFPVLGVAKPLTTTLTSSDPMRSCR